MTESQEGVIAWSGRRVSYSATRAPRIRYLRYRVQEPGALEVRVPLNMSWKEAARILHSDRQAIDDRLLAWEKRRQSGLRLLETRRVMLQGDLWPLEIVSTPHPSVELTVHAVRVGMLQMHPVDLVMQLRVWYQNQANCIIQKRATELAVDLGVNYQRLTIRDQRSRWGSCSSLGNLSFQWRLVLAPPAILDYVVIHELAHLREQNHSPRFWSLVESYCPGHRDRVRWLNTNSGRLLDPF